LKGKLTGTALTTTDAVVSPEGWSSISRSNFFSKKLFGAEQLGQINLTVQLCDAEDRAFGSSFSKPVILTNISYAIIYSGPELRYANRLSTAKNWPMCWAKEADTGWEVTTNRFTACRYGTLSELSSLGRLLLPERDKLGLARTNSPFSCLFSMKEILP